MDFQRVEVISMAVALVAIVGGTAYYYYLTKKPKGSIFVFSTFFFNISFQ
jgi:ABC-type Mn2+/Zn2+ transport system permease subunit